MTDFFAQLVLLALGFYAAYWLRLKWEAFEEKEEVEELRKKYFGKWNEQDLPDSRIITTRQGLYKVTYKENEFQATAAIEIKDQYRNKILGGTVIERGEKRMDRKITEKIYRYETGKSLYLYSEAL
jgi:hypothetical protein